MQENQLELIPLISEYFKPMNSASKLSVNLVFLFTLITSVYLNFEFWIYKPPTAQSLGIGSGESTSSLDYLCFLLMCQSHLVDFVCLHIQSLPTLCHSNHAFDSHQCQIASFCKSAFLVLTNGKHVFNCCLIPSQKHWCMKTDTILLPMKML